MKQKKGKDWVNAEGKIVPWFAVNPVMKVEEKHAQRVAALAQKAEKALQELNEAVNEAQKEVFDAKLKDAGFKDSKRELTPDSLSFAAFDKTATVKIAKATRLVFDKSYVSMVKVKFEEFFQVFDGDEKESQKFSFLREIIDNIMYNGDNLDQTQVSKIRAAKTSAVRLKIEGWELFVEAVEILDKAIRTEPGNRLYYVDVADENGRMRRVALKYTDVN